MDYNEAIRELRGNKDSESFSLGVEEEYFLVESATGQVAHEAPESLFEEARSGTDGRIEHEFLRAQAESVTKPCTSMDQVRSELRLTRGVLSRVAAKHGLALAASGTHPTAEWQGALYSEDERYDRVMGELQMIGERNMLGGMHVHVALPDPARRVEVMRRFLPFLPLFIALATSSPFWTSRPTGLKGYRLAAYNELPRTGLPELFEGAEDFDAYCAALTAVGAIPDSSHLWWAIRPSHKYPTLELRAPDSCTRLDDAIAIAALYRALIRHLYADPACNADVDAVARAVAVENKWRAQRYGVQGSFATKDGPLSVSEFLDKAIALTAEDAEVLGCGADIAHCRTIVTGGTSADQQLKVYRKTGLTGVVEWIVAETARGLS